MIKSGYDMIRYDSLYLTCSKKLMGSVRSYPGVVSLKNGSLMTAVKFYYIQ